MASAADGDPADHRTPLTMVDEGGDPACWAHRVCRQCGRLNEAERPDVCAACGAAFPID